MDWLHVIRYHPVFLEQYSSIFDKKNLIAYSFQCLGLYIKYLIMQLKRILVTMYADKKNWYSVARQDISMSDVLFVSHYLGNEANKTKYEDFYFQNIPSELSKNNISPALLLINHTSMQSNSIAKTTFFNNEYPVHIVSKQIGVIEELKILFSAIFESLKLLLMIKTDLIEQKKIKILAAVEAISQKSLFSKRLQKQVKLYLVKSKAKYIVITYEGHSWERAVLFSASNVNENIVKIAYQHSILFEKQHSINQILASQYNPDYIFTSGINAKKILQEAYLKSKTKVKVLGTNKIGKTKNITKKYRNKCLVLPEGIASECEVLFNLTLEYCEKYNDVQFIWRLHPVIKMNALKKLAVSPESMPGNIIISNKSFDEDIERTGWALYRGSTSIISSVNSNVIPIFFGNENDSLIDPLFQARQYIPSVKNLAELNTVFNNYQASYNQIINIKSKSSELLQPIKLDPFLEVLAC